MADLDDLRLAADRRADVRPPIVSRRLFRLIDDGAFPTAAGRVFLGFPVDLDFDEVEGSAATVVAIPDHGPEPVLVIGSRPPEIGDVVAAVGVAGRWVAEIGRPSAYVYCSGCAIPRTDLVLTVVHSLTGTATTPLVYDGASAWQSACLDQVRYRLDCSAGTATFGASYFVSGSCPTGSPTTCTGPGSSPVGLALAASSCDPFLRRYTPASCPSLAAAGFTSFTITL